ncbi:MAG: 4-(cytidine 5'-diphospho)-2-C-methyl-D-erythritol kinase [Prevotella sp.]|nr:4-(cytidine 5'-diphospho)-2-C-methyl-D-erythritol kinase [Candidatus Prevotella equi]
MVYFPCAKINLGLNIVERRADGYHNLETVFFPVPITDALEVFTMDEAFPLDSPCSLKVTGTDELCEEQKNLVYKAYMILAQDYKLPRVFTHLHKGIPSQAGMGGGSSDAAYMIRLLNERFSLGLSIEQMRGYAARLGADCALFITTDPDNPRPLYATGIGEILEPLDDTWNALQGKWIAFVKPNVAVSTKEAFANIKPHKPKKNCRDVIMQPIETWQEDLVNDFEDSIFPQLPVLAEVKQSMYNHGAIYAAMSGSGSTIFGIFDEEPTFIENEYKDYYNYRYAVK